MDQTELLAIDRACTLFKCEYANVQPHSGSSANQAVFLALLNPGDGILGLSLAAGGHLTHGCKVNLSGKWFTVASYGVDPVTHLIDYEDVRQQALTHRPKLIIAGGSAYPRTIDFAKFRDIEDEVILSNNVDIGKKINSAVFPGLQGGPLMHVIAAKAVCFGEALQPSFKSYARAIIENAKVLSETLRARGLNIITDGTDCHLLLVDLQPFNITGAEAEQKLERAGFTCNKNGIPFDPLPPSQTSGIRLGTPVGTTRGFGPLEFRQIGNWIADVLERDETTVSGMREQVLDLCNRFPIYS